MDHCCRLCGFNRVTQTDAYKKGKFQLQVKRAFEIDFNNDNEFKPSYICPNCVRSLRRWWDKAKKNKKATINIQLAEFSENGSATIKIKWEKVIECAKDLGFGHCIDGRFHVFAAVTHTGEVRKCISISEIDWQLYSFGKEVTKSGNLLNLLINSVDIYEILHSVSTMTHCVGNDDLKYLKADTRHKKCNILISEGARCFACKVYRGDLMSMANKRRKSSVGDVLSSSTRNDDLSVSDRSQKLNMLKQQNKTLKRKSNHLQDMVHKLINNEAEEVNDNRATLLGEAIKADPTSNNFVDGKSAAKF